VPSLSGPTYYNLQQVVSLRVIIYISINIKATFYSFFQPINSSSLEVVFSLEVICHFLYLYLTLLVYFIKLNFCVNQFYRIGISLFDLL